MPSIINATTSTGLVSSADNSGSLQLATNNGTTALTIDTSQNVGIGTTSPLVPSSGRKVVTLNGTTDAMYNIGIGGTYTAFFYSSATGTQLGSSTSIPLQFYTGDVERMRIDSSGRVTMPYQSGFAYVDAAVSVVGSNYILFNGTYNYNVGSILNLTGGTSGSSRVTVPVSGYYDISVSIMGETDGTRIEMFVRRNGANFAGTNAVSTQYNNAHINGIFYLAAGDYLEIFRQSGTLYNSASSNNFFTVRLLG